MTELEQQWAIINRQVPEEEHDGDLWLAMRLYTLPIVSQDEQDRSKIAEHWYLFEEYEQWLIEIKPPIRGEDWFLTVQLRGLFNQAWGEEGIQGVVFGSPQDDGAAADKLLAAFESCLPALIRSRELDANETPSHVELIQFIKEWRHAVMINAAGMYEN